MSLRELALRLRSRDMPEWPRYREGAKKDERLWIESLTDRELAELAAELAAVDRAVQKFEQQKDTNPPAWRRAS